MGVKLTPDQLKQWQDRNPSIRVGVSAPVAEPEKKPSKMGNTRTPYNGFTYDSKAEAAYAQRLDLLVACGEVARWERQVRYPLAVDGVKICTYVLDFKVHYPDGGVRHVDVKGQRSGNPYAIFKMKKALMLALLGIEVEEVK